MKCCGSGMFIPDTGSLFLVFTHPGSRIQKQQQRNKERGEKQFVVINFFEATNLTKLKTFSFL
jgi:hypothetical protein